MDRGDLRAVGQVLRELMRLLWQIAWGVTGLIVQFLILAALLVVLAAECRRLF